MELKVINIWGYLHQQNCPMNPLHGVERGERGYLGLGAPPESITWS